MGIKSLAEGNNIAPCDQESDVGAIYGPTTVWESPWFVIALEIIACWEILSQSFIDYVNAFGHLRDGGLMVELRFLE